MSQHTFFQKKNLPAYHSAGRFCYCMGSMSHYCPVSSIITHYYPGSGSNYCPGQAACGRCCKGRQAKAGSDYYQGGSDYYQVKHGGDYYQAWQRLLSSMAETTISRRRPLSSRAETTIMHGRSCRWGGKWGLTRWPIERGHQTLSPSHTMCKTLPIHLLPFLPPPSPISPCSPLAPPSPISPCSPLAPPSPISPCSPLTSLPRVRS